VTTHAGDTMTTLVIGSGPEDNRLTDVRVMLPGLMAQRVHHLCLDLRSSCPLNETQLTELCRLQQSCRERQIELDLVGLDPETQHFLRTAGSKARRPRQAAPEQP